MATITDETGNVIDVATLPDEPLVLDEPVQEEPAADEAPNLEITDTVAFTFEGDEPAEEDSGNTVIRSLREKTREQARLIKELQDKVKPEPNQIGPKPTLESCGYDEDEKDRQLIEWHERKSKAEREAEAKAEAARKAQETWADRVTTFETKAKELVPNFADIAASVGDHFGDDEQGNIAKAILIYADDPRLVAALNASPAALAKLVAMKNDPTALAIAIGELKGKIKAMPRASAPPPEKITRGGAPTNNATDKELERLEKEAERTRDLSAVFSYKRKMRQIAADQHGL